MAQPSLPVSTPLLGLSFLFLVPSACPSLCPVPCYFHPTIVYLSITLPKHQLQLSQVVADKGLQLQRFVLLLQLTLSGRNSSFSLLKVITIRVNTESKYHVILLCKPTGSSQTFEHLLWAQEIQ